MNNGGKYEYSIVKMMLGKIETDPKLKSKFPIKYIDATFNDSLQTPLVLKENIESGTYLLWVEIDWKSQ